MPKKLRGRCDNTSSHSYSTHILCSKLHHPGAEYHEHLAPTFCHADLSDAKFLCHWSQAILIVLIGVRWQGQWGPPYFIESFHTIWVTVEDCETGEEWECTVTDFFATFIDPEIGTKSES